MLLLASWLPTKTLLSQETSKSPAVPTGFRLVNATGLPDYVFFELDGRMLNPKGFATGTRTGLMGLGVGTYQIKADHPTKRKLTLNLTLAEGDRTSALLFLEETESSKKNPDLAPRQKLAFYPLPSRPAGHSEPSLTIIQLTKLPTLNLKFADTHFEIERLKPRLIGRKQSREQEPSIEVNGQPLCTYNLENNQDYVLVVYANPNGGFEFIKFSNPP